MRYILRARGRCRTGRNGRIGQRQRNSYRQGIEQGFHDHAPLPLQSGFLSSLAMRLGH